MDHQSVVCQKCTGVLLATDSRTYTAQRGRLIVSNGYCTCPAGTGAPEQSAQRQQQAQHNEQAAHRHQQHMPVSHQQQNAGHNSMVIV